MKQGQACSLAPHVFWRREWRGALDWNKRMDYDSFYRRRFRPAAEKIGQPDLRFHDLRHTAASLFAASGMPLARVARVLGHADTATTYRVYLHFFPRRLRGRHGSARHLPRQFKGQSLASAGPPRRVGAIAERQVRDDLDTYPDRRSLPTYGHADFESRSLFPRRET